MRQPFFTRASARTASPRTVDRVVDLSVAIPADRTADPNIDMLAGPSTGRNADMSVAPSTNICPPTGRPTMPPERFFEKIKKLFEKCSILRVSVVLHYEERIKPPTAQRERSRKNRRRQKR